MTRKSGMVSMGVGLAAGVAAIGAVMALRGLGFAPAAAALGLVVLPAGIAAFALGLRRKA